MKADDWDDCLISSGSAFRAFSLYHISRQLDIDGNTGQATRVTLLNTVMMIWVR